MSFKPVKYAVADSSQKASSATDQEGLHFYVGSNFHRPPSEMQVFLFIFIRGLRGPYGKELVGQGTSGHSWNLPLSGGQTGEWALVQEEQMGPLLSGPR